MPEALRANTAAARQRTRVFVILIAAVVILLGLGYLSGYFLLPNMIRSAYQENNCEQVLSQADAYGAIYPSVFREKNLADLVRECAVFTFAIVQKEEKAWHDSYYAFTVYSETYPDGIFSADAHGHMGSVLIGLAQEEITQKKFVEALEHIDLVLSDYGDTETDQEAESLKVDLHMTWGADLRDSGDFAGAERIFQEVQSNSGTEYAKPSQLALAQTYLAWGLSLQSQEKFVDANVKFDAAVSTDPDPLSSSGPAGRAKANQVELHMQWGDYLVRQGDYGNAMSHYGTVAALTREADPDAANDIIASGYLQWASGLIAEEDFLGALTVLDFAQESTAREPTRTLVDGARSDLYLAFSRSNGEQAQKAMQDAVRSICEHQINPRLPIFGLDAENSLAGIDGVDEELPGDLTAMTPGSLHYVACVEENTKVVGTAVHVIGSFLFDPDSPHTGVKVQFSRIQYIWTVTLRNVDSGEAVEETIIEGADPPPLPTTTRTIYEGAKAPRYFGTKPEVAALADWLLTVLE